MKQDSQSTHYNSSPIKFIKDVALSPREIDILACLLSGKSTKGIGFLLSSSPRTIEAHIRSIMIKFEKNSRESVTDLVEKSEEFSSLKNHYLFLLRASEFRQCLEKIAILNIKNPPFSLNIVGPKGQSELLGQLVTYLKIAAVKCTLIQKIPNLLTGITSLSSDISIICKAEDNVMTPLLLICNSNTSVTLLDNHIKTKHLGFVNFFITQDSKLSNHEHFYVTVIDVLKEILPTLPIDSVVANFFCKQHESPYPLTKNVSDSYREKKQRAFSVSLNELVLKSFWLKIFVFIILGIFVYFFYRDNLTLESPVRSDFILPNKNAFVGRTELLSTIESRFRNQQSIIKSVALIGIGGAGKTTLARQYAKLSKSNIVWELNAERKEILINSFENLAYRLAKTPKKIEQLISIDIIKNKKEKERQLLALVKTWLKESPGWILIYDNVENFANISNYFPQDPLVWGDGKFIITSRDSNIQYTENISKENIIAIEELTNKEKLMLFSMIKYDKLPEELIPALKAYLVKFIQKIPGFPLDVSSAAYYLKITGTSYEKYLDKINLDQQGLYLLKSSILREIKDYSLTRYNIITMSIEHLLQQNNDFKDLLLYISLLDSQKIPRELLIKYKNENIVNAFIFHLNKYSLVINDIPGEEYISVHRSTQKIIFDFFMKNLHLENNKKRLENVVNALEEYISSLFDKEDFPRMKSVFNHFEVLLKHKNVITEENEICIEASLGGIYHLTSYDLSRGTELLEHSILKSKKHNSNIVQKARSMTLLGDIYRNYGNYDKSKKLLKESCTIYANSRIRSIDEAYSLASLGLLYQATSNFDKAIYCLESSLKIYKTFPESYIGTARALAYYGLTHANLGLYKKAISFMQESQEIYENHANSHYRLFWILMYIADVYRKIGNYEKATELIENSNKRLAEHYLNEPYYKYSIHRLRLISFLGIIFGELGNYHQAINYLDESLKLYSEHYPKSFDKIWTTAHLAEIYRKIGNYEKAKILIESCIATHNKNLENKDLDIRAAWLSAKLGSIYNDLGNSEKAYNIITRSLDIYKNIIGKDNIKTSKISFCLGEVYKSLGKCGEAIKIFEECLLQYRKNYGDNHIKTAQIMNSLANAYLIDNNFLKAETLLNEASEILKDKKHPISHSIFESLGDLYTKKAAQYLLNGNLKQSRIYKNFAIYNFRNAIKIMKSHMKDKNSIHIIRIQTKLRESNGLAPST